MAIWKAIVLGLVQGLAEFLPVSSSGHLVLLQNIFGIDEGMLFFDTMLHLGTLIAVFAVFYREIWALIRHPLQRKTALLIIATAVTAAIYLAFSKIFDAAFEGMFLGFGFLLTALVLTLNHFLSKGKKPIEKLSLPGAAGVGLIQGIAILPGVSRSGSTIAGSRFFGLSKDAAAEFSFILSIPAILGSLVMQLPDVIDAGLHSVPWLAVFIGMAVAAVSGFFAIRFMLRLIKERSLLGFAAYTLILGIFVLCDQFIFNMFFTKPF